MSDILVREKALEFGISSLNNTELLALIIKSACKDKNVFELANEVIEMANGFNNLLSLSYEELISIKGIKTAKALEILAILEVAKRLSKIDVISQNELSNPDKVVDFLRFRIGFESQEIFYVVYLDQKGTIIKSEELFKGSKNSSIVAVDEVLRKAILLKTSYLIVAHNHPSDNVSPSKNDLELTSKLLSSSKLVGIPLLDHIIIGKSSYFSFKKNKLIC